MTEPATSRGRRTQRRATERRALKELRKATLPLQRSFAKPKRKIKNEDE
jgi:hypothetical protein